ncbi:putative porin [uncultured Desulfosarcina sp.]|uniref:putative porin n=1 Tax=uncultured Desulfosarcina sp. TaxID=218289 RepID=UPI0029C97AA4|nr:putative porin [uncultured Desulfosarcina sp.]
MLNTLSAVRTRRFSWFQGLPVAASILFLVCFLYAGTGICEESLSAPVSASNNKDVEALILLLKQKGLLSEEEVQDFLQRISKGQQTPESPSMASQPSDVQDMEMLNQKIEDTNKKINQTQDNLLQRDRLNERRMDEIEEKIYEDMTVKQQKTSWAERIQLSGDIRLRYQADMYDENNSTELNDPESLGDIINTTVDRNRYRYRARLGLKAKLVDPREANVGKVDLGLRLATGNDDDPVSTNDTFGDAFNKDNILLDQAYLKWSWQPLEEKFGKLPKIGLIGGRMPNPFFSTDLVWDKDLNFEGLGMNLISDTLLSNSWSVFLAAGAFPLEEVELRQNDKWLYGAQIGWTHRPFWGLNYKVGVAIYNYENVQVDMTLEEETDKELIEDWDWSKPKFRQWGNSWAAIDPFDVSEYANWTTGLASDFKELNVTAMIDIDRFTPIHVIFWADYVKNLGYDRDEISNLETYLSITALEDQTEGYQFGVELGYPLVRAWGDWKVGLFYKYLEADAVLDAFTDSDFHGGGTDAEGYILKFQMGLYKNVWLESKYMSTNEIFEETEYRDSYQFAIDTFQLDINAAF